MLVDDLGHQSAQLVERVDMTGVHQHAVGQGARLVAVGLMCLVEEGPHFGVLGQHDVVEMRRQCFTACFKQGHGGFDDGALFGGQHGFSGRE